MKIYNFFQAVQKDIFETESSKWKNIFFSKKSLHKKIVLKTAKTDKR